MSSTNTQSKIPLAKYRPFYNVRIAVEKVQFGLYSKAMWLGLGKDHSLS